MKIVFFETTKEEQKTFQLALPDDELYFESCPLLKNVPERYRDVDILSIFVCSHITKDIIDQFKNLKLIVTRSTGYDHIDIKAAKEKNIIVCFAPRYAAESVAEYTLALLLALTRKIPQGYLRLLQQHSFTRQNLQGIDITGKTFGIIGTGNIGKHVIKMARGFDMHMIAFDVYPDEDFAHEHNFRYVDLETLYKSADIISLQVPLNSSTHHMINNDTIKKLKKGILLINTARGEIIQTQALVYGLEKNIIAGCALDVLEDECFIGNPCTLSLQGASEDEHKAILAANNFLINDPRVIVTPHNAYNTKEAKERLIQSTIQMINAFKNNKPINIIS